MVAYDLLPQKGAGSAVSCQNTLLPCAQVMHFAEPMIKICQRTVIAVLDYSLPLLSDRGQSQIDLFQSPNLACTDRLSANQTDRRSSYHGLTGADTYDDDAQYQCMGFGSHPMIVKTTFYGAVFTLKCSDMV